jgi:hypothetical protein
MNLPFACAGLIIKAVPASRWAFILHPIGKVSDKLNADYVIYVSTKHGRTWRYAKEEDGWTQTDPTGLVRRLSAEQLLSHLLPPLSGDQSNLSVRVERKIRKKREGGPRASTNLLAC